MLFSLVGLPSGSRLGFLELCGTSLACFIGKSKDETMAKRRQSKNNPKAKQRRSNILHYLGPCWGHLGTILGQIGRAHV